MSKRRIANEIADNIRSQCESIIDDMTSDLDFDFADEIENELDQHMADMLGTDGLEVIMNGKLLDYEIVDSCIIIDKDQTLPVGEDMYVIWSKALKRPMKIFPNQQEADTYWELHGLKSDDFEIKIAYLDVQS